MNLKKYIQKRLGRIDLDGLDTSRDYDFISIISPRCIGIRIKDEVIFVNHKMRSFPQRHRNNVLNKPTKA